MAALTIPSFTITIPRCFTTSWDTDLGDSGVGFDLTDQIIKHLGIVTVNEGRVDAATLNSLNRVNAITLNSFNNPNRTVKSYIAASVLLSVSTFCC